MREEKKGTRIRVVGYFENEKGKDRKWTRNKNEG
jgi:hypothetical protein